MKSFLLLLAVAFVCTAASRDDRIMGGTAAPVRVEIFSSFDCEPCKQLHEGFLPLLVQNYVLQGKVYVVPHESPLQGHALARKAADYATAAARIGKYWPVADALFQHQAEWEARGEVWTTVAAVLTPQEKTQVQSLLNDPSIDAEVERDASRKFQYIPTILVTSGARTYPVNGLPSFDFFRNLLDLLLSGR
jgi:protein-disulfide isomerase